MARAEVERHRSLVEQYRTELDRLQIRSPIGGQVLKVDVRPGEYVGTPPDQPLWCLGDLAQLHVRIDIDEQDIPRFKSGMPGTASIRGNARELIPLHFVRVEPYVQPKLSLTGLSSERVDTRVLQVIYGLAETRNTVYVGQQVDVFLDAKLPSESVSPDSGPRADAPPLTARAQ